MADTSGGVALRRALLPERECERRGEAASSGEVRAKRRVIQGSYRDRRIIKTRVPEVGDGKGLANSESHGMFAGPPVEATFLGAGQQGAGETAATRRMAVFQARRHRGGQFHRVVEPRTRPCYHGSGGRNGSVHLMDIIRKCSFGLVQRLECRIRSQAYNCFHVNQAKSI